MTAALRRWWDRLGYWDQTLILGVALYVAPFAGALALSGLWILLR